jgi:2-keto-4-pentenoate hydratase/2-oxohepta-3-ene-1,7-dioic acid hydratase in catechol pathway
MGYVRSADPSVFFKPPTAVIGPGDAVMLPPSTLSRRVEHEAELGIVIGREGRFITEDDALNHVLGFTCADDISARDLQRSDPYPTRAKGFDTFCPIGPWLETDVSLTAGLRIQCRVNGVTRQDGSTSEMIRDVPFIISFVSQFTTLLPGDLLLTGSPGGSGPLVDGDVVEIEIDGIGVLRHFVTGPPPS